MLRTDVENLIAHLFADFEFEVVSDNRFDVVVPGWRFPVRGVRELERILSASPELALSATGDNYAAAFFDGHYNGQPVQICLLTTEAVATESW